MCVACSDALLFSGTLEIGVRWAGVGVAVRISLFVILSGDIELLIRIICAVGFSNALSVRLIVISRSSGIGRICGARIDTLFHVICTCDFGELGSSAYWTADLVVAFVGRVKAGSALILTDFVVVILVAFALTLGHAHFLAVCVNFI